MREGCGVEVELHPVLLTPFHPALEVSRLNLVTVNVLALEITVDLVQVQTLCSTEEALHELDVAAELVDVAGAARVVAGRLDSACEGGVVLEAHHVVSLPALEGDRGLLKKLYRFVCVHADGGVTLFGHLIGLGYQILVHIIFSL